MFSPFDYKNVVFERTTIGDDIFFKKFSITIEFQGKQHSLDP